MTLTADAALTVEVIRARGWEAVKLGHHLKKPDYAGHWITTTNADTVADWFAHGANVGLVCHERTGLAVLDPDDLLPWAEMVDELGQPSLPWVKTGSGKLHYYVAWEPDLPAKLWPVEGEDHIGEIQAGPGQDQVVLPGSIHPDTGKLYRWITDALGDFVIPIDPIHDPLPRLPDEWVVYLGSHTYAP
jgi:hypothetical protein